MADEKVYYPETLQDTPFPQTQQGQVSLQETQATANDTYAPQVLDEQEFPDKRVALELLSQALNTRSKKITQPFGFTPSGALQIGQFTAGISGDIRISPAGIVARNTVGDDTFVLDGETGDAFFAGEIRSGSVVTGEVIVGDNRIIIDGANRRIIINDGTTDRVLIGFQKNGF